MSAQSAIGHESPGNDSRRSPSADEQRQKIVTHRRADPSVVLGIISDTHGLLRPEAVEMLTGCDRILHAGDVGIAAVLEELQQIAPVTAVRGNVDTAPWARALPIADVVEAGGVSIYILHDLAQLNLKPEAAGFGVVIYGHTHQPKTEQRNGVLYFNPGSAGPRRFRLPVSVGKLTIEAGQVHAEWAELKI
ncbi:MAG: metallophosphoesterase family protein [Terriglobales bacterium]